MRHRRITRAPSRRRVPGLRARASQAPSPSSTASSCAPPSRVNSRTFASRRASAHASARRSTISIALSSFHDEACDLAFVLFSKRIGRTELGASDGEARAEAVEDPDLAGGGGDQMKGMHGARLPDAIDAADSLLETHRIPRQF